MKAEGIEVIKKVLLSFRAKHSIFNAILARDNEGKEVILALPCWVTYPEMIKRASPR
jgi:aspartate aminotransferase